MVTLADLKDAIEYLALGQLSLSIAVKILTTPEVKTILDPDSIELLEENQAVSFKYASDVFEKLFALEPKV